MAKPTTSGLDYGHRTYMGTTSYPEAIGRPSDKQYDNRVKRPHSDDKKPYMEDEYPEMEHYYTPYNPPNFIPPGIPDDPRIPPVDPNMPPGEGEDQPPDDAAFTGCLFTTPRGPSTIQAGQTTWTGMGVTAADPLVRLYVNYGPVNLLTDYKHVNACLTSPTPNCIVSAQAKEAEEITDEAYPHKSGEHYLAQIVGQTLKGYTCAWDLEVFICPPDESIAWDSDNSAETIAREASATIYVTGGIGPFHWEVAEDGYRLAHAKTNGRSNTLYADADSCGTATITVQDACEEETTGHVRNTTGYWAEKESQCGLSGAAADWSIDCTGGVLENIWKFWATVISGNKKQYHYEQLAISSAAQCSYSTSAECEACRAGYSCGSWDNPCLAYPSYWTLRKPPGVCPYSIRWQGDYYECGGNVAIEQCVGVNIGGAYETWSFKRAYHVLTSITLRYWEWECA